MSDIRIEQLCKQYAAPEEAGRYPDELVKKVGTLCLGAKREGRPEILSENEAAEIARWFPDLSQTNPATFARLLLKGLPPPETTQSPEEELGQIWRGFAETALEEPGFLSEGFVFKKIKEGPEGQTVRINNAVTVVIAKEGVTVEGDKTRYTSFPYEQVADLIMARTGRSGFKDTIAADLTAALFKLPFMETYATRATGINAANWRYTKESANAREADIKIPIGKVNLVVDNRVDSRLLNMDGFGRFYVAEQLSSFKQETRFYLASPAHFAPVVRKRAVTVVGEDHHHEFEFFAAENPISTEVASSGTGCFGAETLISTADGAQTLGELHARYMAGEALPQVTVYNPTTGETEYQSPASILQTYIADTPTTLESLNGLTVTSNHNLWVRRNGEEYWMPAGYVAKGDELKTGTGVDAMWIPFTDRNPTYPHRFLEAGMDVYNIGFAGGQAHNFLVSPDGTNWLIAHNKRW